MSLNQLPNKLIFTITILMLFSCNAYMHGYTWSKARNQYHLVNGDKNNFGDQRIKYNKGFHNHFALSNFLDCNCNSRGLPDFIYEYITKTHCRGINLYYVKLDSVYIFEEPKRGKLQSVLKIARKMDNYEHQTYNRLTKMSIK